MAWKSQQEGADKPSREENLERDLKEKKGWHGRSNNGGTNEPSQEESLERHPRERKGWHERAQGRLRREKRKKRGRSLRCLLPIESLKGGGEVLP